MNKKKIGVTEEVNHARNVLDRIREGHQLALQAELRGAAHDLKLQQGDEATRRADECANKSVDEADGKYSNASMSSPLERTSSSLEKRELRDYETLPPPEEYHKYFASGESWVHRQALAARATSPRWKERLLRELQMWKVHAIVLWFPCPLPT